jgi:hypothetical protein
MLQARQAQQDGKAAARATFMELASSSATLAIMHDAGIYVPLEATTWRDTRSKLANRLSAKDFAVVATAYMRIEVLIVAMGSYQPRDPLTTEEQKVAGEAFDRVDAASSILEVSGWNENERQELRAELTRLAKKPKAPES